MQASLPTSRYAPTVAAFYSAAVTLAGISGAVSDGLDTRLEYALTGGLGMATAGALWLASRARSKRSASHFWMMTLAFVVLGLSLVNAVWRTTSAGLNAVPGQLPIITSTCFALLTGAILLHRVTTHHTRILANGLSYAVLVLCLLTLVAQVYGVPPPTLARLSIETLPWASLPIFIAIALGGLTLGSHNSFQHYLLDDSAPAKQLRIVMPMMISMPLLIGLITVKAGEQLAPSTIVGITTISAAVFGAMIVVVAARYLNSSEQKLRLTTVELERALQREEDARAAAESASNARDTFVSFIGHELRAPLNAALTWLDLMALKPEPSTMKKGTEIVRNSIETQVRLIQDLSDIARVTAGELSLDPERFDLRAMLEALSTELQPLFTEKSLQLDIAIPAAVGTIDGDRVRLQQVIRNVLMNAHRYTPAGGTVKLSAAVQSGDDSVAVSISDTGQGIPRAELETIFEPYWRANNTMPGLGIGLALARAIVEAHDGSLSADSAGTGKGSTFVITLPQRNSIIDDTARLPAELMTSETSADN